MWCFKRLSSFSKYWNSSFCVLSSTFYSSSSLPPVKDADSEGTLSEQRVPAVRVFSGHMKLDSMEYNQKLEDTKSKEFQELADDLEEIVSLMKL